MAIAEDENRTLALQREHLAVPVSDLDGETMRRFEVGDALVELQQERSAVADHRDIGDRRARQPVRVAQLDAAPESRQRAHHAAIGVIRVAQTARRVHFPQRIGEGFREAERGLVLGAAGACCRHARNGGCRGCGGARTTRA